MKFAIIDTYYSGFLNDFRKNNPGIDNLSYNEQKEKLINACFGTSDFYSYNLIKIGHEADDFIVNDEILQRTWAKENNLMVSESNILTKLQALPFIHKFIGRPRWVQEIALEQIRKNKPDVVYVQDLSILNPNTLREAKKYCKLIVGQIACPMPAKENLKEFDLILTSFPHYIEWFRKNGIKSEYLKIAFDSRILDRTGDLPKKYEVSFIGSYSYHHRSGTKLFENIAKQIPVQFWGYGAENLSNDSPILKNFHGSVWGIDMYKILAQSKIVLNRHISAAENNANNMRLYEATGMGAMLITDKKNNLGQIFEVGKEVVEYDSEDDLVEKIKYYLNNEVELDKIAQAGQRRTLKEHTYQNRMEELVEIMNEYIS